MIINPVPCLLKGENMTAQKVLDAIVEGLDGAESSEANRIRESTPYLAPSEKRKLARALIAAFAKDQLFRDEDE
jgi:hypothetical protein